MREPLDLRPSMLKWLEVTMPTTAVRFRPIGRDRIRALRAPEAKPQPPQQEPHMEWMKEAVDYVIFGILGLMGFVALWLTNERMLFLKRYRPADYAS